MRMATAVLVLAMAAVSAFVVGAVGPGTLPRQYTGVMSYMEKTSLGRSREEAHQRSNTLLRLRGAGDPDAAKEKELGNAAYSKKDFETALTHYKAATELEPSNMIYWNNMAAAYFGKQNYQECVDTCKKAIEVGNEHRADFKDRARAFARMGNALLKLDDLEGAIRQFDSSIMEHRDPQVELKLRETKRLVEERAAKAYLDPAKAEELRQKGNELFKEGKWVDAINEYTEGLRRDPENHLIYSNRGATYIKVMDFGSALRDCETCIKLKPEFPRAYARKATVEMLCKQIHKAKETIQKGLAVAPEDAELKDIARKVQQQVMGVGLTPEEREQRAKEAMKDPNIVSIMQDPIMRQVLDDMQRDPSSAHKHMQDARVKANIETLMAAGIIQTG